jgi:hypothetical protein
MPKQLDPRQYAILRHVWSLSDEERGWLDYCQTFRVSYTTMMRLLDDMDDAGNIHIKRHNAAADFELCWPDGHQFSKFNMLQARAITRDHSTIFAVALVKQVSRWSDHAIATFEELK